MTVDIVTGFETIHNIMSTCIKQEMQEGGLLEDVETFIPIYHNESGVDEPCVWMTQHPTTAEKPADISNIIDLITPFEFDCVVYEPELEDSERAGQNLAYRVILSILKNFLQVQHNIIGKRIILRIDFQTYYPVGEVNIEGKSDSVPGTGVILNVIHRVNWQMRCKKIKQRG